MTSRKTWRHRARPGPVGVGARTAACCSLRREGRQRRHRRGSRSIGASGCGRAGGSLIVAPRRPAGAVGRTDFDPGPDRMTEAASQAAPRDLVLSLDREERQGI